MINKFEKLSETLDVDFEPTDYDEVVITEKSSSTAITTLPPKELETISEEENEAEKEDFQHSRQMLRKVIHMGEEAIQGIKDVASASEEPRAFEVVAISIKSVTEAIKTLYDLHAIRKRIKEGRIEDPTPSRDTYNVDKAVVFTGTGAELLSHLKEKQKDNDNT